MYTKCNLSNAMKNLYMKLICNKNLCAFYMNAVFFLNQVDVLVHELVEKMAAVCRAEI